MSRYLIPQLYPKSREIAFLYLQIDLIEQNNGPCEWVQAVQDRLLYSPAAEAFFVVIRPREKNLHTALKTTKFRKEDGGYDILPKPMFVLKRKAPEKLNLKPILEGVFLGPSLSLNAREFFHQSVHIVINLIIYSTKYLVSDWPMANA